MGQVHYSKGLDELKKDYSITDQTLICVPEKIQNGLLTRTVSLSDPPVEVYIKAIEKRKLLGSTQKFTKEVRKLLVVSKHPNIQNYLNFYQSETHFFIVTERHQDVRSIDHLLIDDKVIFSEARCKHIFR
jgi:hypothetical protein